MGKTTLSEINQEKEDLNVRIADIATSNDNLTLKMQSQQASAVTMQLSFEQLERESKFIVEENNLLKAENETLQQQARDVEERNRTNTTTYESLIKEYDSISNKLKHENEKLLSSFRGTVADVKKDYDVLKQEHHVVCTRRIELERLCKNLTDENEALKRTHGEMGGHNEEKVEDLAVVEGDASVVVVEEQCDVEEVSETFAENDDIALIESDDDSIGDGGAQLEYEYENIGLQAAVKADDVEYLKLIGDCEKLRFDNDELLE